MKRVSLSAIVGAAVLAGGLISVAAPAAAACVGIASCAGGNRFATGPGAVRPGAPAFKPAPGPNSGRLVGTDGASLIARDGAGFRNPGVGFRPR